VQCPMQNRMQHRMHNRKQRRMQHRNQWVVPCQVRWLQVGCNLACHPPWPGVAQHDTGSKSLSSCFQVAWTESCSQSLPLPWQDRTHLDPGDGWACLHDPAPRGVGPAPEPTQGSGQAPALWATCNVQPSPSQWHDR
jgi:hypothetical protein